MGLSINKKMSELYKKHPWLKITTTVEDYVAPEYYNKLLKDYIFLEKTDLQLFEEYFKNIPDKEKLNILELGSGSGRATSIFLNYFIKKDINLKIVDLSDRMLDFCRKKFKKFRNLKFIKSDLLDFLDKDDQVYDFIFSLWSFSHSVHQMLIKMGTENGKKYVQSIIKKTIKKNMKKGSRLFIVHFDSKSDEQKILMKQWKKVYSVYNNTNIQSPSKLILDKILKTLSDQKLIKLKISHYSGKKIIYSSNEKALEVFLNFHMESYFNNNNLLPQVVCELNRYFKKFTNKSGSIEIKPGCFIYVVTKIK
jgi:SAM-dependent methyltransferase